MDRRPTQKEIDEAVKALEQMRTHLRPEPRYRVGDVVRSKDSKGVRGPDDGERHPFRDVDLTIVDMHYAASAGCWVCVLSADGTKEGPKFELVETYLLPAFMFAPEQEPDESRFIV